MPRPERPVEPGDGPLVQFALDLRKLREAAGSPTLRELAVHAGYTAGTLSEAAGGRKLPSLAVTRAYASACGADPEEWERRWREVSVALADEPVDDDTPPPYLGLSAFQVADSDRYHGRDALLAELVDRVHAQRLVGVLGASGSGKSSLLRAGLAAAFADQRPVVVFTPGTRPLHECAAQLAVLMGESAAVLAAEFDQDPTNLHLRVRQAAGDRPDVLIIVDQFEEVFTLCADPDQRRAFIAALAHATIAPRSQARVVLGVRADFFGHCARHVELRPALRDGQVLVDPMNPDELRAAVTKPALAAGYTVETALVTRLVAEATNQPGVLPLVSHALLETWRRRRGMTLTLAAYEEAGGIQHALDDTSEAVYTGLDADQQRCARDILTRLTAFGDGTDDTKRRLARAELDDTDDVATVLSALAQARLVTLDRDSVELAHEALITNWLRLRDWLSEDRDGLRIHRQLTEATDAWFALDRDPGALYRGVRLASAEEWAGRPQPTLTQRERCFLDASVEARLAAETAVRSRTRRLRVMVAVMSVLAVVAVSVGAYAMRTSTIAVDQRNQATAGNARAESQLYRAPSPDLALKLGLAAYRLAATPETIGNLLSLASDQQQGGMNGEFPAYGAALSPDGRWMAVANKDGLRLANIARRSPVYDPTYTFAEVSAQDVTGLRFSPDGRLLAVELMTGSIRLFDVSDRAHPRELPPVPVPSHLGPAAGFAFSPNGTKLAVCSNELSIVDLTAPRSTNPQVQDLGDIMAADQGPRGCQFSHDGRMLVAYKGNTVAVVRKTDGPAPWPAVKLPAVPNSGFVVSIGLSHDDGTLAVAQSVEADQPLTLWDVSDPARPMELSTLTTNADNAAELVFSHDDRTLLEAEDNNAVRVWNIEDHRAPNERYVLTTQNSGAVSLVLVDGDTRLVAFSNQLVWRWDLDVDRVVAGLCSKPNAALSEAEWARELPGVDYRPSCG